MLNLNPTRTSRFVSAFSLNHRSLTDFFPLNETSHKKKNARNQELWIFESTLAGFMQKKVTDECSTFRFDVHESEVKPCFRSQVLPNKRHVQICQPRDLISVIAGEIVW